MKIGSSCIIFVSPDLWHTEFWQQTKSEKKSINMCSINWNEPHYLSAFWSYLVSWSCPIWHIIYYSTQSIHHQFSCHLILSAAVCSCCSTKLRGFKLDLVFVYYDLLVDYFEDKKHCDSHFSVLNIMEA